MWAAERREFRRTMHTHATRNAAMSDGGELDVAQVARAYQLRNAALKMKLGEWTC